MSFDGRMPDWLYRSLPAIYAIAGITVIYGIRNEWAYASGGVLIGAAVVTLYMRRRPRRSPRKRAAPSSRRERKPAAEHEEARAAYVLSWDSSYETGHEVIDAQHKALLESCNRLIRSAGGSSDRAETDALLDPFIDEVERHFRSEEAILGAIVAGEILDRHRHRHEELALRARDLVEQFRRGRLDRFDMLDFLVSDLVAMHVISEARMEFLDIGSSTQ